MKVVLLIFTLFLSINASAIEININYHDEENSGFNSKEVFTPTIDNPSTTLGGARRYVLERIVKMLSAQLTSNSTIYWGVTFADIAGYGAVTLGPTYTSYSNNTFPDNYNFLEVDRHYPAHMLRDFLNMPKQLPSSSDDYDGSTRFTRVYDNYTFTIGENGQRFASTVLHELVHLMGLYSGDCLNNCLPQASSTQSHFNKFSFVEGIHNLPWAELTLEQKNEAAKIPDNVYFKGTQQTLDFANTQLIGGVSTNNGIELHSGLNSDGSYDGQSLSHLSSNVMPMQLMHSTGKDVLNLSSAAYILCDIGWCKGVGFVSDLGISSKTSVIKPNIESLITYEIANLSEQTVTDIEVEIILPENVSIAANSLSDNCQQSLQVITCQKSELHSQEYSDIDINVIAPVGTHVFDSQIRSNAFVVDENGENNLSLNTITSQESPFPEVTLNEVYEIKEAQLATITPSFIASEEDNLEFFWVMESGSEFPFEQNTLTGELSFTAPTLYAKQKKVFKLTIKSNGRTVTKVVEINIVPALKETEPTKSNGGGGGSTNLFIVMILTLILIPRKLLKYKG